MVLITGASSGIGKELAYVYARHEYNLILVARRKNKLEEIKQEIEKNNKISITIVDMDLSLNESAENLYKNVHQLDINIDVLINNAGFGTSGKFKSSNLQKEESMIMLNLVTLTKLTRLFIDDFLTAGSGNIINIASTAAFQSIPNFSTYAATKAYVLSFSEAIAYELKDDNINVTTICPGATQSEFAMVAEAKEEMFVHAPTANELAEFTYKAMINKKIVAIHGFKNKFMAFSQRFAPRNLVTRIAGKMME